MESSGKLLPQLKSESSSKYASKLAKFEEFRQQREKEKQDRLARIERRKQELRDRRVTEIQKSLNSLQLKPIVDSVKPQAAGAVVKFQPPANLLSTDIKLRVMHLTHGQPGSAVKRVSACKESARRTTIATRGLPSTAKKLVGTRVQPSNLTRVKNEKVGASYGSPAGTSRAVKRHLLVSGIDAAKKPCLESRNANIRPEGVQMQNADKKPTKESLRFETGSVKSRNDNTLIIRTSVRPQKENNLPVTENRKKLSREQELELWRQKKLQQTADVKSKIQTLPRRETLPATRPGLPVLPTAARSSAVTRTSSVTQQARTEMPKKKCETLSSVHVKSRIDSVRAKPVQFPQNNPSRTGARVTATSVAKSLAPRSRTFQRAPNVHAGKPELQKSGKVDKTSLALSTVFSASEPATPELKGPRMSTPYSSKRSVGSPSDLLQLSSIVGSRVKGLTSTWTPKTPKTPRSALSVKLEKWLAAHGKTPSRYRHLTCYGVHARDMSTPQPSSHHHVQKLKQLCQQDEKGDNDCHERLQKAKTELIEMFAEATSLVNMGFPSEHLMTWLNNVAARIPDVKQMSYYWSCKAHLAAAAEDKDGASDAVQILEEGAKNGAQPEEELEKAKTHFSEVRNRSAARPSNVTHSAHKRLANEVQPENIFDSSSVKFSLKRIPNLQPSFATPQKVVVTPVRRSTRRSCAHLPAGLRDHDTIVESVDEIPVETRPATLFQSNIALNLQWRFLEPGDDGDE